MTDLRKAAEMALEALVSSTGELRIRLASPTDAQLEKNYDAIKILRQALAQPEQEPVAWMYVNDDGECEQIEYGEPFDDPSVTPLYTAPPKREWIDLTEEEAFACRGLYFFDTYKNINDKLKEKNT